MILDTVVRNVSIVTFFMSNSGKSCLIAIMKGPLECFSRCAEGNCNKYLSLNSTCEGGNACVTIMSYFGASGSPSIFISRNTSAVIRFLKSNNCFMDVNKRRLSRILIPAFEKGILPCSIADWKAKGFITNDCKSSDWLALDNPIFIYVSLEIIRRKCSFSTFKMFVYSLRCSGVTLRTWFKNLEKMESNMVDRLPAYAERSCLTTSRKVLNSLRNCSIPCVKSCGYFDSKYWNTSSDVLSAFTTRMEWFKSFNSLSSNVLKTFALNLSGSKAWSFNFCFSLLINVLNKSRRVLISFSILSISREGCLRLLINFFNISISFMARLSHGKSGAFPRWSLNSSRSFTNRLNISLYVSLSYKLYSLLCS